MAIAIRLKILAGTLGGPRPLQLRVIGSQQPVPAILITPPRRTQFTRTLAPIGRMVVILRLTQVTAVILLSSCELPSASATTVLCSMAVLQILAHRYFGKSR